MDYRLAAEVNSQSLEGGVSTSYYIVLIIPPHRRVIVLIPARYHPVPCPVAAQADSKSLDGGTLCRIYRSEHSLSGLTPCRRSGHIPPHRRGGAQAGMPAAAPEPGELCVALAGELRGPG